MDVEERRKTYFKFLDTIKSHILPKINDEIIKTIPEWKKLLTINSQFVCVHTLNVLYLVTINEEVMQMSKYDQNIMAWAALMHDICKLGPPVFEGKDHIHPFKGARYTLSQF